MMGTVPLGRLCRQQPPFQLFGLFGYPLTHTLSPAMQEAGFSAINRKAFYLAFELDRKHFREAISGLKTFLLDGFNVTVPYKEAVIPYLDELTPKARMIGAVNTVFRKGRKWAGTNTDAEGFLISLKRDALFHPRGKKILILGAGGAARAVTYALAANGAKKIILTDLYADKAQRLARHFSPLFRRVEITEMLCEPDHIADAVREADLVVNATTVGLKPSDPVLVSPARIPRAAGGKRKVFYDLVYHPSRTAFLKNAAKRGHRVSNGLGMLLYQGVRAFEIWTGEKAPVEAMRRALLKALKEREKKKQG